MTTSAAAAGRCPGRDRGGGRARPARGAGDGDARRRCAERAARARDAAGRAGAAAGEPAPRRQPSSGCASKEAGWWDWAVEAGDEVGAGQVLGRIRDLWGDVREEIVAPQDGVVLFITSSPSVSAEGLLLGLGADLAATDRHLMGGGRDVPTGESRENSSSGIFARRRRDDAQQAGGHWFEPTAALRSSSYAKVFLVSVRPNSPDRPSSGDSTSQTAQRNHRWPNRLLAQLPDTARRGRSPADPPRVPQGSRRPPHVVLPSEEEVTRCTQVILVVPPQIGSDFKDRRGSAACSECLDYPLLERVLIGHVPERTS